MGRDNNVLSRDSNGQDNVYPIVSDNNSQLESDQHTRTPTHCVTVNNTEREHENKEMKRENGTWMLARDVTQIIIF